MKDIKVLCIEERYIEKYYLLADEEPFEQYEYFKILDERNNNPICKVIKTRSIKRLEDMDNQSISKNAVSLGFDKDKTFYWAEVLIEKELKTSLNPDSIAIKTTEQETYDYLYSGDSKNSLILGEIRGTEHVYENLEENTYKNILMMCDSKKQPISQKCLPMIFDYKKLQESPNIGIFGNSGSGKTFALKSFIEELILKNIPTIIFDPHNEFDFSNPYEGLPDKFKYDFGKYVETFTAGIDFGLRFTDLSNDDFKRFLENTTSLTDPQSLAIESIRESADSFEAFKNKISTLANAKQKAERGAKESEFLPSEKGLLSQYGKNISSSIVLFALNAKLDSYSRKNFFNKNYDCIINALKNRKVVVIRGDYNIVTPMMSIILNDLWKKRKLYKDGEIEEEYPPIITILDEAHLYAPKDMNIKAPLKNTLIDISREGRKYGMFLICATQRISELNNTVLSQMSTKIILKTSQESDKFIIQKECGLNEAENNRLHMLDSGHGYIISPILKTKTALAFKARCNYSKPKITINAFDELNTLKMAETSNTIEDFILQKVPFASASIALIKKEFESYSKRIATVSEINNVLDKMVKDGLLNVEMQGKIKMYSKKEEESFDIADQEFS